MRILAVTPWVPSRRRPRSLGLLSMLGETHEVKLVAACWNVEDHQDLASLPFDTVGVDMRRTFAASRAALSLFTGRALQQGYLDSPAMRQQILTCAAEWRPDALYLNTLRTAQWSDTVACPKKFIDLDEFRSNYYQQVAAQTRMPVWRAVSALEAKRMRIEEQRILERFDRVLVSSPTELNGDYRNLSLVRSPHALPARTGPVAARAPGRVVFVGRMSYAANVRAISWFVRKVWPAVVRSFPTATLDIVGDQPSRRVRNLASTSVRVLGRVQDVSDFYSSAEVSVVPVDNATGVQMKLIEALSYATPTVATPLVARQAGVAHMNQVLVASTADQWSAAVVQLLRDADLRAALAGAGLLWSTEKYSSSAIQQDLLSLID